MKVALRSQVLAVEMARWTAPTDEHEARLAAAQRTLELVEMYEDDVRAAIAAGLARDQSRLATDPALAAVAAAVPDAAMTLRPAAPRDCQASHDHAPGGRLAERESPGATEDPSLGAGHEEDPSP